MRAISIDLEHFQGEHFGIFWRPRPIQSTLNLLKFSFFFVASSISLSATAQRLENLVKNIELPQNIELGLPEYALFEGYQRLDFFSEQFEYTLEQAPDSLIKVLSEHNNILTNPRLVYPSGDENPEIEASYVVKATNESFKFHYQNLISLKYENGIFGIRNDTIFIPDSWERDIGGDLIETIWIECYARIDGRGFPIEKKLYVNPVLISSANRTYRVQRYYDDSQHYDSPMTIEPYSVEVSFSGYILKNCQEKPKLRKKFINKFNSTVERKFSESILSTTTFTDLSQPDDELWLKREYKRSLVLDNFYFENSTYRLRNTSHPEGVKFFVSHVLNISTGVKGKYIEGSKENYKEYQEIVHAIVNSSMKTVCSELHLNYVNQNCQCY